MQEMKSLMHIKIKGTEFRNIHYASKYSAHTHTLSFLGVFIFENVHVTFSKGCHVTL